MRFTSTLVAAVGALFAGDAARAQTSPAPASAERVVDQAPDRFTINAFDVSGVTRLTATEVETIVYPFLGPDKSTADVQAAQKALQDAYNAKGLEAVLVDLPVQPNETFGQGVVTLAVSESPLGRVRVTGSKYHAPSVVLDQVPSLRQGQPVDLRALQADVAAANRFPDRTINPSFRAGQVPGTIDVDLAVEDEVPVHGHAELNNDYSPNTTELRYSTSIRFTNLWQAGHSVSLSYLVAPERRSDTEVISASYTAPLIGSPWTLSLFGYKSNSNIAALGGANVLGDGYQIGARAIYRLPGDRVSQTISFGPDYKDFKQDITVGGVDAGSAPIRYVPFNVEYALGSSGENSNLSFNAGVTFGLRIIRDVDCVIVQIGRPCVNIDQFRAREFNSNENFLHLNASIDYTRAFLGDFLFVGRAEAQYADSPLVTNEQFGAGGLTSNRGYLLSEAIGDDGFSESLELRSPSFGTLFGSFVTEARVYGFADFSYVKVRGALPGEQDLFRLISVGGGLKLRLFDLFNGEVLAGVPLRDGSTTRRGDARLLFVARGEF